MDSGRSEDGAFCHQAAYYDGAKDYLPAVLPFVLAGLSGAEPVLVMVPPAAGQRLREGLAGQAAGVTFADMSEVGRNPGRIIPAMWDFVGGHQGRPVRVLAEPLWPARTAAAAREAVRHEALVNLAFAATPVRVLCPYDVGQLAAGITASAGRTHAVIRTSLGSRLSPDYAAGRLPAAAARSLPPAPARAPALAYARDLRQVRDLVGRYAGRAGLDADRTADLVLAASEAAANTLRHTTAGGVVRVWHHRGEVICQVSDQGRIDDPLAGRRGPPGAGGLGLWVVNQVCDLVELRTGRHGTTVRMHMCLPVRPAG